MCQFFSCNSDGKGKVIFFKIEDVVKEMAAGNKKNYNWNSHTSISDYHGIKGLDEDRWNKWEYNPDTQELKVDSLNTTDDRDKVLKKIKSYFKDKNVSYLRNLYNFNSGNCNSGGRNSGDYNSGDRNSGNYNSGYRNSGDCNSGNYNSGYRNSGNYNSGDYNSGNRNSGNCNPGTTIGHFCNHKKYFLFNKPCSEKEANEIYNLELYNYFNVSKWIYESDMTEEEKKANPNYKITGGYLKKIDYKEAWKSVPKEVIDRIKKLKNFNKKVFEDITGVKL